MSSLRPNIALIDDHFVVRKGLRSLVESFDEFNVLFDVDNFKDLQTQLKNNRKLDILLLDIKMPEKDGFAITLWMREHYPLIKVLAVSSEEDGFSIAKIIRNGAKGFCGKSASPTELLLAIHTLLQGNTYLSQDSLNKFNEVLQNSSNYFTHHDVNFTEKEREFIKWSCTAYTYNDIAERMNASIKTIEGYRNAVFVKLNIQTRQELAVYATQNKLN